MDEISKVLRSQGIVMNTLVFQQWHNQCAYYLLDQKKMLKISKLVLDGHMRQRRVHAISHVPKIYATATITVSEETYHYLITDYVQGDDLWHIIRALTEEQKYNVGKEIAQFLIELHQIKGSAYDMGHYIPTIPTYKDSWKNGHVEYVEILKNSLGKLDLELDSKHIVSEAFDYIYENINVLEYQMGAKLLHNDFHPKNMIIDNGKLSGVIDWECSQFGEADFELVHLFHWCIYPSVPDNDLELVVKGVIDHLPFFSEIPNIEKRLTIYQLEHELNQIVWNGKNQEAERVQRISGWLDGRIDALLAKWC